MEVYSQKWGQCHCYKSTTQKMYFRFMEHIKFYKVALEDSSHPKRSSNSRQDRSLGGWADLTRRMFAGVH